MEIKALTLLHSSCYCCPACQDHLRNEYFKSTFGFMILTIVAIKRWSNALYPHHDCLRWSILRKWCNIDSEEGSIIIMQAAPIHDHRAQLTTTSNNHHAAAAATEEEHGIWYLINYIHERQQGVTLRPSQYLQAMCLDLPPVHRDYL